MPRCPNCETRLGAGVRACPCGHDLARTDGGDSSRKPADGPRDHRRPVDDPAAVGPDASPGEAIDDAGAATGRRDLLRLGAAGLAGAGVASAGWLVADRLGGSGDGADDESGPSLAAMADWLPAPASTPTPGNDSFFYVDATRVREHADHLRAPTYRHFARLVPQDLDLDPYRLAFQQAASVLVAPGRTLVLAGDYDAGALRAALATAADATEQYDEFTVGRVTSRDAVGVADRAVLVGRQTLASGPVEGIQRTIDAERGEVQRYTEDHDGASALVDALDGADYAAAHPVDGAPTTDPERGLFEDERGFGLGVSFDGPRTTTERLRIFEGSPPRAEVETWAGADPVVDGDVSVDGDVARVTESLSTNDLWSEVITGAARDLAGDLHEEAGVEETEDGYLVSGSAFRFGYDPVLAAENPQVETDTPVTFRMTSRDALHSVAVEGTAADQLLVPGEVTEFTVEFDDPGERSLYCTRYCGQGHDEMEATLSVVEGPPETSSLPYGGEGEYLADARGYDAVTDRRGDSEVTVTAGSGEELAFDPAFVQVDPGTTITWEFLTPGHNVTFERQPPGADVSGTEGETFETVPEGSTHTVTAEVSGTYLYYCTPHESLGMKGGIAVGPLEGGN